MALALLGALSVYGMSLLVGRMSRSPVTSAITIGPLELKLELLKTEFLQGEPVNITVSLKNVGNTTITVNFTYTGSYVGFKVSYENGTEAIEGGRAVLAAIDELYLAPGEQVSHTYTWDQTVEIRVGNTVYGEQKAPPGTYKIVGIPGASIGVVGIGRYGRPETPPITVTIKLTPLKFSIQLDKREFERGENITIQLSLKNTGNETIVLIWSEFYLYMDTVMYFDFVIGRRIEIADVYTLVYRWTKAQTPIQVELKTSLNPGEQLTSVYLWNQTNNSPEDYPKAQVPKGIYSARGFTPPVALTMEGRTAVIFLTTPKITFTIK